MKKTTIALTALAAVAAIGGASLVGVGLADDAWAGKRGGHCSEMKMFGGHGGHSGGKHRHAAKLFDTFDKDGDGSVTAAEVDIVLTEKMTTFDGDGGGTLSLDEFQALWLEQARFRMVDHFQFLDDDGDGQITADELEAPATMLVERLDRNGDGSVSKDELRRHGKHRHHGKHHKYEESEEKDESDS